MIYIKKVGVVFSIALLLSYNGIVNIAVFQTDKKGAIA